LLVVEGLLLRIEQAGLGVGQLAEHLLAGLRIRARLERLDVEHLPRGSLGNYVRIGLEQGNAQQTVVRRGLLV
jgi:hypothetical protein